MNCKEILKGNGTIVYNSLLILTKHASCGRVRMANSEGLQVSRKLTEDGQAP